MFKSYAVFISCLLVAIAFGFYDNLFFPDDNWFWLLVHLMLSFLYGIIAGVVSAKIVSGKRRKNEW